MRSPALAIGNGETRDQILARQPVEAGRRRIEDGVAVLARYLAASGTMILAGGADFSVALDTALAAQTGTSQRPCHRGPTLPVCGTLNPPPKSAPETPRGNRQHETKG